MLALRSVLKKTIAMLGLVAVLLGALEHEDLILQEWGVTGFPAAVESTNVWPDSCLAETSPGSGTEATFRSEVHRFWLLPRADALPAFKLRAFSPREATAISLSRSFRESRSKMTGIVVLRL